MTARRVTAVSVGTSGKRLRGAAYACRPMRIVGKVIYWLAVLAISLVLLVVLMRWFESQDASEVEGSAVPQLVV
jgi:tellurite resistance protein TehA-like permease